MDGHTEDELGYCIGVLARGVHDTYVVGRGCGQVDIVVAGSGTYYDFQVLGSVEHFGVDNVAAHDDAVDIFHGVEQFGLFAVFFEEYQLHAGAFYFFANAFYRNGGKGLICCY